MSYRQRKITVEFTLSDGRTFGNGQGNMLTITDAKLFCQYCRIWRGGWYTNHAVYLGNVTGAYDEFKLARCVATGAEYRK
ncbi:Uncharacterised protein [Escherichia coli]|nr:Uncharacterised protein [Escherichia coli]